MPMDDIDRPFESIESAHEYMTLLANTTVEAMVDLRHDRDQAVRSGQARTAQAIDLAIFKLTALNCLIFKSRRALNDLRTLRRLILNERLTAEDVIARM
jgi:hypothetical protein